MIGLLSQPMHKAMDHSSDRYQLFPQSQPGRSTNALSSTVNKDQGTNKNDVTGTGEKTQCTCEDNTMAVFWDEAYEPCLKCRDSKKAEPATYSGKHKFFTRQNGMDGINGEADTRVDIHAFMEEEADMEDIEDCAVKTGEGKNSESSRQNQSFTMEHNLKCGFSSFSQLCSESEETVVGYKEEDMTSSGEHSHSSCDTDEDVCDEQTQTESDEEESESDGESETEQVVPSYHSDDDIGPMLSSLYETDYSDKMYESKRVDAKLKTRFGSGGYSRKTRRDMTESLEFGAIMGKLQITEKYRFPKLTATEIEDVVNFWEMDFQVGHYIVPRLGSWESKGLAPNKDRSPVDCHRYEVYRDLYRKWIHCNHSLEQWYAKYGCMSLEHILHSTGKGHKRKYRTVRPLSAGGCRSPREKRICLEDKD